MELDEEHAILPAQGTPGHRAHLWIAVRLANICGCVVARPPPNWADNAGWTVLARVVQSMLVGWLVVKDKEAVRLALLYPLRDLIGSILWIASYASRRVGWRDDLFELTGHGVARLVPGEERRASAHH